MAKNRLKKPEPKSNGSTAVEEAEEPEQKFFPEMAPEKIPAIHKAALTYRRVRDERMNLTVEEVEAKDVLMAEMKQHNRTRYEYDDIIVEVKSKESVKVKSKDDEVSDEGEETEE